MKQLGSLYRAMFFALILLLLTTGPAVAELIAEAGEIPYQVTNSDRIVIGTVIGIDIHMDYTIFTIRVKEWLYGPLPENIIKVRTETGRQVWTEDQAEFTQNESVLLMLDDRDLDKQLFTVSVGFPGKRPVSDRDAVIKELKAQGKWQEGNQTGNKTTDTRVAKNTETAGKQEEKSNFNQESKTAPFISPFWGIAAVIMADIYFRKNK